MVLEQIGQSEVDSPYPLARPRTAPPTKNPRDVATVFGRDLGGTQYCRSLELCSRTLDETRELTPDFLRITARMADWTDLTQAQTVFLQHRHYHRADPAFQRFLRYVPIYVQTDDHEVVNDHVANRSSGKMEKIGTRDVPMWSAPVARRSSWTLRLTSVGLSHGTSITCFSGAESRRYSSWTAVPIGVETTCLLAATHQNAAPSRSTEMVEARLSGINCEVEDRQQSRSFAHSNL